MNPPRGDDRTSEPAASVDEQHAELITGTSGEVLRVANEFADIQIRRVETRNGARLVIESRKSGQWVSLCPLELEALTWQNTATFSAMIGTPFRPLIIGPAPEQDASP